MFDQLSQIMDHTPDWPFPNNTSRICFLYFSLQNNNVDRFIFEKICDRKL